MPLVLRIAAALTAAASRRRRRRCSRQAVHGRWRGLRARAASGTVAASHERQGQARGRRRGGGHEQEEAEGHRGAVASGMCASPSLARVKQAFCRCCLLTSCTLAARDRPGQSALQVPCHAKHVVSSMPTMSCHVDPVLHEILAKGQSAVQVPCHANQSCVSDAMFPICRRFWPRCGGWRNESRRSPRCRSETQRLPHHVFPVGPSACLPMLRPSAEQPAAWTGIASAPVVCVVALAGLVVL